MSQNFNNAKIYKITNDFNDEVYVGSTCDTLIKRFSAHKQSCKCDKKNHTSLYVLMNEIGFERFRIDLIEDYPCSDKQALRQREGYFIREMGTLNKRIAGRTDEEYEKDNKEKRKEYFKEYREVNKEAILERCKNYLEQNKEKRKETCKNYYENNKEKILEKRKDYDKQYQEKLKEKIQCECGLFLTKRFLKEHQQSKRHMELMEKK